MDDQANLAKGAWKLFQASPTFANEAMGVWTLIKIGSIVTLGIIICRVSLSSMSWRHAKYLTLRVGNRTALK